MAPCLVIMTDTGGFSDGVSLLVNTVLSSPNAATNASFSHFLPVHSSSTAHWKASWQTVKGRFTSGYLEAPKNFKIIWLGEY